MIKCRICGRNFQTVNSLHLRIHNTTFIEYKQMFPNAPTHAQETKNKIARGLMGNTYTLGHELSNEHKKKISLSLVDNTRALGHKQTILHSLTMRKPSVRNKISKSMKKYFENPVNRIKHSQRQKVVMNRPEVRLKNSQAHQGVALSKIHAIAIMRACYMHPNKTEQYLLNLLGKDWAYTGGGDLVIGSKCPDFWNGDHKLIELYGDYWHRGENPQDRIDYFKQYGYNCLVIWEHELEKNEKIKQTISAFCSATEA